MNLQQYTVTLTDLGTYTLKVAAADEKSAQAIAIDTLHDAAQPTPGLSIVSRTTDTIAVLDEPQPSRIFKVTLNQIHELQADLPAEDRASAILQARRIFGSCGPFLDFDLTDCRISDEISAVEVKR